MVCSPGALNPIGACKKKTIPESCRLFSSSGKGVERILRPLLIEVQLSVLVLSGLSCIKYWNHTELIKQKRFQCTFPERLQIAFSLPVKSTK